MFRSKRIPTEAQIQEALKIMSSISPAELGLESKVSADKTDKKLFSERGDRVIEYLPIYEGGEFDIGIFCMPSGAVIPLHDHPGMTVMSRLLYGKLQIRAFDVLHHIDTIKGKRWKVRLNNEIILQKDNGSSFLLPDKANLHFFKALTACAVLDVLAPPYNPSEGRDCTYYRSIERMTDFEDENGFLKKEIIDKKPVFEVESCLPPWDFMVKRATYCGSLPRLNED